MKNQKDNHTTNDDVELTAVKRPRAGVAVKSQVKAGSEVVQEKLGP